MSPRAHITGLEAGYRRDQTLIDGRFEIEEELGRGASGVVYHAFDRLRRQEVVLKHLWSNSEGAGTTAEETKESFRLLTQLKHPGLPQLIDWGEDGDGRVFYTKSVAAGVPASTVAGKISASQVASIAQLLADTVSALHRAGYCHGDIKPDNLLVECSGQSPAVATLIDFGLIFRSAGEGPGVRGTAHYIAPELLSGANAPGPATDLYALGATLYHLLYGRPPFSDQGEQGVADAVLIDRILNDKVDHPAAWWSLPQGEDREAAAALIPIVQELMSADRDARERAMARAQRDLVRWAPRTPRIGSVFVGRRDELERLNSWVDGCLHAGEINALALHGDPGAGKRRLLGVFLEPLRSRGVPVLEHDSGVDETDVTLSELARKLLIHSPDRVARPAELLGELTGHIGHPEGGNNPQAQRLLDHLAQSAGDDGLVLVIHASRPAAAQASVTALIDYLGAESTKPAAERPKLAVLINITGALGSIPELVHRPGSSTVVLPLGGLTADESAEFCARNLSERLPADLVEIVHGATNGVPAALERVVAAVESAYAQGQTPTTEMICEAADQRAGVLRALRAASPHARAIVETMAVLDTPLGLDAIRDLLPKAIVHRGTLEALRAGQLVRRTVEGDWCISSPMVTEEIPVDEEIRDGVIQRYVDYLERRFETRPGAITPLRRLAWLDRARRDQDIVAVGLPIANDLYVSHAYTAARRAFSIIAGAARAVSDESVASTAAVGLLRICVIEERGDEAELVGGQLIQRWAETGGSEQLRRFLQPTPPLEHDWGHALESFTRALPTATRVEDHVAEVLSLMTDAARLAGNLDSLQARAVHAMEAVTGVVAPRAWRPLFRALARILYATPQRQQLSEALVALLEGPHNTTLSRGERAELHNLLGILTERDDLAAAVGHYEKCILLAAEHRNLAPAALKGLGNLLRTLGTAGEIEVARYHAERWLSVANDAGLVNTHEILGTLSTLYDQVGRPYLAFQTLEDAFRMAIRAGNAVAQDQINVKRIYSHARFGLRQKVLELAASGMELAAPDRRWMPPLQLVYAHLLWGETEEARERLAEARAEAETRVDSDFCEANLNLCEAKIALQERRFDVTLRTGGVALLKARRSHMQAAVEALLTLTQAEISSGDLDAAGTRLHELDGLIRKHHLDRDRPAALYLRALLEQKLGSHDRATQLFQRACDRLEDQMSGMPTAYREGFLRAIIPSAIVRDASTLDTTERGHLLEGMKRILQITNSLHRASDQRLVSVLGEVLDQIIDFTSAERGILFRIETVDKDHKAGSDTSIIQQNWGVQERTQHWGIQIAYARGFDRRDLDKRRTQASGTVLRRVVETAAPVLSADATEDMRFSQSGSIASLGMRSILAFPLEYDGNPCGIVYLDSPHGRQFSETDKELLILLGNQLGPVVEMAHRREESHVANETFPRIIGNSRALVTILEQARKVAPANVAVLILGETGTGKEMLARGVHEASLRARRPFVAINCASLPDGLVEAELFGAERGAYTGAHQTRKGYFEQGDGGTVFLDEIGDLPMAAQAKLLRVLQEGVIRRVGSDADRKVDVRIVAATHRDLEQAVSTGEFRQDLFYRLNVVQLRLPPLRERPEDIPALVQFFYRLFIERHSVNIPPPPPHVVEALQQQPWPGNIRQLRNAMERSMLLCSGGELTLDALMSAAGETSAPSQPTPQYPWPPPPLAGGPGWGAPASPQTTQPGQPPPAWGAYPPPWAWGPPPAWAQSGAQSPWQWSQQMAPGQAPGPWGQQMTPGQHHDEWSQQPTQNGNPVPDAHHPKTSSGADLPAVKADYHRAQADYRYEMAMDALRRTAGNKKKAAELMGISRRGLYRILEQKRIQSPTAPEIPPSGDLDH
jgi:DNA-binding NtrC family response regulator/serine/threonine protein kinase/tetratricopeptide (TPR) repeat protein